MDGVQRLRATSVLKSITFLLLALVGTICILWENVTLSIFESVFILAVILLCFPYALYYLFHATYLTEEGIECCQLGHVYRKLLWNQVAQVSVIRDFRWTAKTSGATRIVITPIGCEKFSKEKWFGVKYLFVFRHQVIWIDNTKQNKLFIRQHYGEIIDFEYGNTLE